MLEVLKDFDKETSIGLIMVVVGILVWFEMAKFVGIGLVVYGVSQMFWKKDEIVQTIEEHHHHHHHNKPKHKKAPRKKNG
jgi:predicted tellurium resistance membrane protein TerC